MSLKTLAHLNRAIAVRACLLTGCVLGVQPALSDTATIDTSPAGMAAFFPLDQCPSGWSEAVYARGRLLLGFTDTSKYTLGKQVGTALANETEPADHSHTFQTKVSLDGKGISGTDGCCVEHAPRT